MLAVHLHMDERDRKDRRHLMALPVTIVSRNADVVAVTEDVSLRGIFLRMVNPPKTLQLIRMKMKLEPTGTEITVLGVGRHVIDPGGGHATGVGIEFFGLEGAPRIAWEAFIHYVQNKPPAFDAMTMARPFQPPPTAPARMPAATKAAPKLPPLKPPSPPMHKASAKPIITNAEPEEVVLDEMDLRSIPPESLRA